MAGVKFDITGNANGFVSAARQAEAAGGHMVDSITREGKELDDMFKRLAGAVATIGAGLSASALTKQIFDIRSEFQQLEVAFSTMLKSEEKAHKLMLEATEFAATTPFDLKGVAAGIKQNLAYGASVDTVIDEMRMLGDVAAGVGAPLNDLVYLYGTLRTSGRVATIDIRQFAGRGIPIYEELAKVLGVAKNEVAGLVTAGKVGFADIEQAFKNMTSEGGMFNNLMANQSKTLQGQLSNLEDSIDMMFNEIGQSTQGVMADTIGLVGKLVDNYQTIGRALAVLVATYGTYKAAILAVAAVEKVQVASSAIKHFMQLTKVMSMATAAQTAFNVAALANPYVLAATALTALITGVVAFTRHKKAEVEAQKEASREVAAEVSEVNTLVGKLKDANTAEGERVKALERLKEIAPEVVEGIDLEKDSLEELNTQLEEYNELKTLEIALKASTQYLDFTESIESVKEAQTAMQEQKAEIINTWGDLLPKITEAIASGEIKGELKDYLESFIYDPQVEMNEKILSVTKKYSELVAQARNGGERGKEKYGKDAETLGNIVARGTNKTIKEYAESAQVLEESETSYANAVDALRKRIHDSVALVYTDAEEAVKAESLLLRALGLEAGDSTAGNGTGEKTTLTEKQKEEAWKREQAKKKAEERFEKLTRQLNAKVAKADIDSMEEGYAKTLKTLEYNLEQERLAIEDQKKELLKSKYDEALKTWMAEDPEGRKEYQFVYKAELTPEEEEIFRKMGEQAQNEFNRGKADANKRFSGDAFFAKRQFEVDAMEEGASKDAAQRHLDNERELHDLEMQRDAYIEAARAIHIFAVARGEAYGDFDLAAANEEFNRIKADTKARQEASEQQAEKDSMNEYLIAYGDYQQKKVAIKEKYEALIAKSGTEGEAKTYAKQMEQELFDLEVAYGKTANVIANLFGDMRKKSAKDLNDIADQGAKALEFIKKGEYSSDNAFGISQEQFELISNSPEELSRIAEAINDIREQADALEGPFQNLVEGFKEIANAAEGTEEFEEGLARIGEGTNQLTDILGFLSDSLGSMGEAIGSEGLVKVANGIDSAISVMGNTMSGAQAGSAFGPWGAAIGAVLGLATSLTTEISKAKDAIHQAEIDRLAEQVETIEHDYDALGKSIEKAYSVDASELIRQQNILLEQKKRNLQLMIAEEKAKKNADSDQIKQWEDDISSIESTIEDNAEKAQEAITGISFDSFRDSFLSSLLDMENGAEEFADDVEEKIRKAMYEALLADKYQSQLDALYENLAKAVEGGNASEIAKVKAQINDLYGKMEDEARLIDDRIGYESSSTRSAAALGRETASQSSIDEMNGRATAIQSHTFSINQHMSSVVAIGAQILGRVSSIDGKASRLEDIEKSLSSMKSDISDMLTKGIKVKA